METDVLSNVAQSFPRDGALIEVAPDIAALQTMIVNVAFVGEPYRGSWVLVDAGMPYCAGKIRRAADRRFGSGARPRAIVLTHGYFDHVGSLRALADAWDVPIYAHPLEFPYLTGRSKYPPPDPTVGGGAMARLSPLFPRGPYDFTDRIVPLPLDGSVPHLPGWRWIHTPGHTPGHVSFWRPSDRTLIAGDAFITTRQESAYAVALQKPEMHGPPMYYTQDWTDARRSVQQLASLEPEFVITGHGHAMRGQEMRAALHTLARDFERVAVPEHGRYVADPARPETGTAYAPPKGESSK